MQLVGGMGGERPQFMRINLDNPEDREAMLLSGAIWSLPQFWQIGIDAIARGEVPLAECPNIPPEIAAGFRAGPAPDRVDHGHDPRLSSRP